MSTQRSRRVRPAYPDGTTFTYAHYQVTIKAQFDDQTIWRRQIQTRFEQVIDSLISGQHHPTLFTLPQALDFFWLQNDTFRSQFLQHENLPAEFLAQATEVASDAERAAGLQSVSQKLATLLRQHQREVIRQLVGEFSAAGGVHAAGKQISGAKALWESFVTMGLPRTLEANDLLRALIYGDAGVPDEMHAQSLYAAALSSGPATQDVDITLVDLPSVFATRATALNDAVNNSLGAIESRNVRESVRVIDGALDRLDILVARQQSRH